ncbi:MAG: FtsH protease activity modulator HflK [Balneolales bacterium]
MANENYPSANLPPELRALKNHVGKIISGAVVLAVLFTSIYQVGPEEVGVVLQFGKYDRTVTPGLNYKLPLGIEDVYKIPVERQLKQEFGFRTGEVGVRTEYMPASDNLIDEAQMLTGDLNLADVEWVVQYRIHDPYQYLFKVRNAEKSLHDMSEASMRKIVGDRTVNEVLTVGRQEVATRVEEFLQSLANEYELGITIDQVVLQDVNPPDAVRPSFNAVNQAQQQRETLINEALSDFNRVIPRARGAALETIERAEGFALNRVNRAEGEADRFTSIYEEYILAPEVTKKRLYLETMSNILPNIGSKVIMDDNGNNVLPLLQMQPGTSRTMEVSN